MTTAGSPRRLSVTPNPLKRGVTSTNSTIPGKPQKPSPDFPLIPRGDGRWCKRVHGKLHYFTGTASEAQDEWNRVASYLKDGRTPPPKNGNGLTTVGQVVNHWLTFKQDLVESEEITSRTFLECHATCSLIVDFFGRDRVVEDLLPDDF
jgi:hypothetical protein